MHKTLGLDLLGFEKRREKTKRAKRRRQRRKLLRLQRAHHLARMPE